MAFEIRRREEEVQEHPRLNSGVGSEISLTCKYSPPRDYERHKVIPRDRLAYLHLPLGSAKNEIKMN